MNITWFGTASLLIENNNDRILIDPFFPLKGATNHPTLASFSEEESILITHGHVDHLQSVPFIMEQSDATVYCSELPANTLEDLDADGSRIVVVKPQDRLLFGSVKVTVLKGKHIEFDKALVKKTLINPRVIRYFRNLLFLGMCNRIYKEGQETLAYQIEADGKTVLVLGSMNLDDSVEYPKNVDMLVLPYQGSSNLVPIATDIIRTIEPRSVMLDHFDDAFPPLSNEIDTKPLKKALAEQFPNLAVVKPTFEKTISVH